MVSIINHITSCCGAGKSYQTINKLYLDMAQGSIPEQTVLVSSKTQLLLVQNEDFFNAVSEKNPHLPGVASRRIDDKTSLNVTADLNDTLRKGHQGVLFITHKALSLVNTALLQSVRIIIDEIPSELIRHHAVIHSTTNNIPQWSTQLKSQGKPFSLSVHAQEVDPPSSTAIPGLQEFVDDVRSSGEQGANSKTSADLVEFILSGHGKTYTNTSQDQTRRYYNAICDKQLVGILKHASHITILSAQLKETVLGFILLHCLNIQIIETNTIGNHVLPKKHQKHIRIIPFLKQGKWSRGLKDAKARDTLMLSGSHVKSQLTCGELAQEFSGNQIPHDNFFFIKNKGEDVIASIQPRATDSTNQIHGMNSFMHLHHVSYVATSIPAPYVIDAYNRYLADKNSAHQDIKSTIKKERCHEAAYQCIARTSLRDALSPTPPNTIVVPDMEYLEYIKSWFDQRYVTIDDQASYVRHHKSSSRKTAHEWIDILSRILTHHSAGTGSISTLCAREGVSRKTFYNKKEEFRGELIKKGHTL